MDVIRWQRYGSAGASPFRSVALPEWHTVASIMLRWSPTPGGDGAPERNPDVHQDGIAE